MPLKVPTIFLLLLSAACLHSCENSMAELNEVGTQNKNLQIETATGISTYLSQGGQMKAHLTAPLMNNYHVDVPYIEFSKGLHVDFYKDSLLQIESVVDAKYSRYFTNEGKVLLQDSVVVHNRLTGDSLKTNEMWWDQQKQLFYGNKPVIMYVKGVQSLTGTGFTAKQDFSRYTIDSNTTGTMRVPDDMGLQ
jgi:LPS export ABC transporter protein LptC